MAVVINGTTGIDKVQDGSIVTADIADDAVNSTKIDNSILLGRRNILRNGAMRINQRNDGTSVTYTGSAYHVDRVKHNLAGSTSSRYSIQRLDTAPPTGFTHYYRRQCTTAESIQSGTQSSFDDHRIESSDLQQLSWGSSSISKSVTLSFWIKGNVTGTYAVWFYAPLGGSTKMMTKTYTIDTSDTWEYKTITIPPRDDVVMTDTITAGLYVRFIWNTGTGNTSGTQNSTWGTDTTTDRYVGHGVNLASATGNYIEMTGTQLEAGTVATQFEHRTRDEYTFDCQRYCQAWAESGDAVAFAGKGQGTTSIDFGWPLAAPLRASPTITQTGTGWRAFRPAANLVASTATATVTRFGSQHPFIGLRVGSFPSSSFNNNYAVNIGPHALSQFIFDSEL